MNDNLINMVMEEKPSEEQPPTLDLEETAEPIVPKPPIKTICLTDWFKKTSNTFDNIKHVQASIRGINPRKTLIITSADLSGAKDASGNIKRKIHIFENADSQPVLDIDSFEMKIYNNGFRIMYQYDNLIIKCYGIKSGLIITFCNIINDQFIPYKIIKLKKTDETLKVIEKDIKEVTKKLSALVDKENLQLLYKQISKTIDEIKTNQDVVNWLLERQKTITDVNHHVQIDTILIEILQ